MSAQLTLPHIWIITDVAREYLDVAQQHQGSMPQLVSRLRQSLSAEQTHEVLSQTALRRRAARKFAKAPEMFFTDIALQQATDERIAAYKSSHYSDGPVADLCCGIGGDLLALAGRQPTIGVEMSDRCAAFAMKNCQIARRSQATVVQMKAEQISVKEFAAWHIDPDRRPGRSRTSQLAYSEPSLDVLNDALVQNPNAGIKLAPAAEIPVEWARIAQAEWIGERDECRQLFLRCGSLAASPASRTATLVNADGRPAGQISGPNQAVNIARRVQRYVHEPHACVRAAELVDRLAARHNLQRVSATAPYLTGDQQVADALLASFEVEDVLPFDLRRLKRVVRQRGWHHLEIKKRGCDLQPERLRRQLRVDGEATGVILLTPHDGKVIAILAQRASIGTG